MSVVDIQSGIPPGASENTADKANEWDVRRIVLATITVLAVGVGFLLLYRFYLVVFSLAAAIMLHIAVKPTVERLRQWGLRFEVSVVLVYLFVFVVVALFGALLVPLILQQAAQVVGKLPGYYSEFRNFLTHAGSEVLQTLGAALPFQFDSPVGAPANGGDAAAVIAPAWDLAQSVSYSAFVIVSVFMMAFQWTLNHDRIIYKLLLRVPQNRRDVARELVGEIESKVGSYFHGQLILCGFVGVLETIAFAVIGLPGALALGLFAFIFEAVPMFGPAFGALPALLVALSLGLDKVIWVAIATVIVQQIESNILVPRIMDKTVGVKATVSILAITAFSLLFGLPGALLAIPFAAIFQIFTHRLLFNHDMPQPPAGAGSADVEPVSADRSRLSLLRLQARELAQDVRKRQRVELEPTPVTTDHIEDLIEVIATDLDSLLTRCESESTLHSELIKNQSEWHR